MNNETPWMTWLEKNKGWHEVAGEEANPFIIDCFNYTSLKGNKLALSDETAWCAALACAALEKNGYLSPHSAAAIAFDNYGTNSTIKYGAILTFKRTGGSGRHVTFFVKEEFGYLRCIGGNQKDALKESLFPKHDVMAIRWPVKNLISQSRTFLRKKEAK